VSFNESVALWLLAVVIVSVGMSLRRGTSLGLPLTYLVTLSLIHVPGALVYADGEYAYFDPEWVRMGFAQSAVGAACFSVAGLFVLLRERSRRSQRMPPDSRSSGDAEKSKPAVVLAVGAASWLVLLPLLSGIASLGALVSGMTYLVSVGIVMGLWRARMSGVKGNLAVWVLVTALLPVFTTGSQGFLGYGAVMAITISVAAFTFFRQWPKALPFVPVVIFFGLSVFVTYMRDREELRGLVWGGASVSARADRMFDTMTDFEWFDSSDMRHRLQIDRRLNQNWMCGLAEQRFERNAQDFAGGESLLWGITALIPRAVWPDKPAVGGGGELVSRYTGVMFAEGTSVGAGQVLEFYVNFGWFGIVLGFAVLGALIAYVDSRAADSLRRGDWRAFIRWFTPGLALIQPGGNFAEVTTSAVAAAIVAWILIMVRFPYPRIHPSGPDELKPLVGNAR